MEAAAPTDTSKLLMLDEPRVIALRDGKHTFTFHFRKITARDWDAYFKGIYVASRTENNAQVNTTDLQTAGLELFESTVTKVQGYSRELSTPSDFAKVLPKHSIPVSWSLRTVGASTVTNDSAPDPDVVETSIDALWSQTKPGDETTMYLGLIHRFAPPTIAQKKRLLRNGAISRVVGGSRQGTTIYAARHTVLVDIYDELIQSVEGYGLAGRPLDSIELIRREMDSYHKLEAASQLFNTQPEAASEIAA
jgi:hypothetical protein